jgi:uncharacterized protein
MWAGLLLWSPTRPPGRATAPVGHSLSPAVDERHAHVSVTKARRTVACSVCSMTKVLAWMGDGAPRMEVSHVTQIEPTFAASGTQLGDTYELRYLLGPETLHLELVGERTLDLGLDGADFFDLGWSPLFNSLPVIRDRLLDPGPARGYRMRWVEVPSLQVTISEQLYTPLGDGVVRFQAGEFVSDIEFDPEGFVTSYPGIGARA